MTVWRYLPLGRAKHALESTDSTRSMCSKAKVERAEDWRGTGNQKERERLATIRACDKCELIVEHEQSWQW